MDFVITGENVDIKTEIATLQFMFQAITANPQALQIPIIKKLLQKMANLSMGLNPLELDFEESQSSLEQVMMGGDGGAGSGSRTAPPVSLPQGQGIKTKAPQTV